MKRSIIVIRKKLMKRKLLFMFIIATVLAPAGSALAGVVLPTGVDEYRVIFATSGGYQSVSTDIAWYNTQVTLAATSSTVLDDFGTDWYCVGSTASVDVRDNITPGIAWNSENIPIYNTQGELVEYNVAGLFGMSMTSPLLVNPVRYDEDGNAVTERTYTGSNRNGTAEAGRELGTDGVTIQGYVTSTYYDWIEVWVGQQPGYYKPLYGISSVIPEPATLGVLALGALAGLIRRKR